MKHYNLNKTDLDFLKTWSFWTLFGLVVIIIFSVTKLYGYSPAEWLSKGFIGWSALTLFSFIGSVLIWNK